MSPRSGISYRASVLHRFTVYAISMENLLFTTSVANDATRNISVSPTPEKGGQAELIPILAKAVREVEASTHRGKVTPAVRSKFHAIALLVREVGKDLLGEGTARQDGQRSELHKRLEGIATILARAAGRDTSLIQLVDKAAVPSDATKLLRRKMLEQAGLRAAVEPQLQEQVVPQKLAAKQVVPAGIESRIACTPFLQPSSARSSEFAPVMRLANWDLLGPLLKSFEQGGGQGACKDLPEPLMPDRVSPKGLRLMPHQSRFVASVLAGHRSFLLADEPGLGKTAQSLVAANVSGSFPLLVVVPNVVKMNWAREAAEWSPGRKVSVIHGDGQGVNAFADIFIVNYDILDRHLSWMTRFPWKGMVIDEAHLIKNRSSQRSTSALAIAASIKKRHPLGDALLVALTGTPLINGIEDFRAIWLFLGWLEELQTAHFEGRDRPAVPSATLLSRLEHSGFTPADPLFYPTARQTVIDMGIVRRRKTDVAKDLPEKSIVDLPVELDGESGQDVREAEQRLRDKLLARFQALKQSRAGAKLDDEQLVRMACASELDDGQKKSDGVNIFTLVRQIGEAKAALAADYTRGLVRSVGKVVFFAKHIAVMDEVTRALEGRGIKTVSVRGDQSAQFRQSQIDAFNEDPEVHVAICSLTAAGVGVNLQASSNVVLAELSWTDAEQTQAIDRVHRIGQEEPVTAWRIIAAKTVDQRVAELLGRKAGLAARALDGAPEKVEDEDSLQLLSLIGILREALGL